MEENHRPFYGRGYINRLFSHYSIWIGLPKMYVSLECKVICHKIVKIVNKIVNGTLTETYLVYAPDPPVMPRMNSPPQFNSPGGSFGIGPSLTPRGVKLGLARISPPSCPG
jgi:hypothetical protein